MVFRMINHPQPSELQEKCCLTIGFQGTIRSNLLLGRLADHLLCLYNLIGYWLLNLPKLALGSGWQLELITLSWLALLQFFTWYMQCLGVRVWEPETCGEASITVFLDGPFLDQENGFCRWQEEDENITGGHQGTSGLSLNVTFLGSFSSLTPLALN